MPNFQILKNVFNIFFPQKCAFCGDISDNGYVVCNKCKNALNKIIEKSNFNFRDKKYHYAKRISTIFEYNDLTSKGILRLKNIGDKELIEYFGELLYEKFCEDFTDLNVDIIIPVPMHKKKQRIRGFNHAYCIAEYLAEKTNISLENKALIKVKNNKTQHFLSEQQRKLNILGVYTAINEENIKDKDILIVDDVMTTGSTLEECAKVLYKAGATSVSAIVIAATSQRK